MDKSHRNRETSTMRLPRLCLYILMLLLIAPSSADILGNNEYRYLNEGLAGYNIELRELGFDKLWTQDTSYRLEIVSQLMNHPLDIPEFTVQEGAFCDKIHHNTLSDCIIHAAELLDVPFSELEFSKPVVLTKPTSGLRTESDSLRAALSIIISSFDYANPFLERFSEDLTDHDIERLLVYAPILWSDSDDSLESDSLKGILYKSKNLPFDTTDLETDTLLAYIKKLNRKNLFIASYIVQQGVETALRLLEPLDCTYIDQEIIIDSTVSYGRIVVGGSGSNHYDEEYAVIIDLGGDDRYQGRCASAIGKLHSPFAVVIDLSGNDAYVSDQIGNFGAGLLGCGVLIDIKGDDVYRAYHNSLGTGLFGTGLLIDNDGTDVYEAGFFSEGAGFVGTGILYDNTGDDMFRGYVWTQGFGSTFGYGLLVNTEGDNAYTAGGRYKHYPLRPNDHRSLAQGFGFGFRSDAAGGIGFLYDAGGNDFYNAEIYAQGCSYWYSLGILFDRSGNDYYTACQYAQGAGIHLSTGMLLDMDGSDHYFSRFGPSQGEGHDLSVGILMDKTGNDSYVVSGGQGVGLTNSCGIFIDADGNDIYASSERLGEGSANNARGFGGIGVFIDIGGRDTYPQSRSGSDETIWQDGSYGVGIDVESSHEPEEEHYPQRDTLGGDATVEEIFDVAAEWAVLGNETRVQNAQKRLKEFASEAITYVLENKMDTKSSLEMIAIVDLAKEYPDSIEPFLLAMVSDTNKRKQRNSIYLLGQIKSSNSVDTLITMLRTYNTLRTSIVYSLGEIGDWKSTSAIVPFLTEPGEKIRVTAAEALGKISDHSAVLPLIRAFNDHMFTVRLACENSIVAIGDSAIKPLLESLGKTHDTSTAFHAISALGRIAANQDSIEQRRTRLKIKGALIPYLNSVEKSLRAQAVKALSLFHDHDIDVLLKTKQSYETDPFVIGMFRKYVR